MGTHTGFSHVPVLLQQVLSFLAIYKNGVYVDATAGLGGHAEAILEHTGPASKIIGIDQDEEALAVCRKRLEKYGDRVCLIKGKFFDLRKLITCAGYTQVNAILLDLGVSSLQLDDEKRGFSFLRDGPLDMRMDRHDGTTAEDIIHALSETELVKILKDNAQERYARLIARAIVRERNLRRITRTSDLARIITDAVPPWARKGRIHPATKTFQALRMEVNQEMKQLEYALPQIAESLMEKGRMAIISFHSGEDRIVKDYIFNQSRKCVCPPHLPLCVCKKQPTLRRITKKPVVAEQKEVEKNPRARSARMRVAEKVA